MLLHYGRDAPTRRRADAKVSLRAINATGGERRLPRSIRPTALLAGRQLEADMAAHGTYYAAVLSAGMTTPFLCPRTGAPSPIPI